MSLFKKLDAHLSRYFEGHDVIDKYTPFTFIEVSLIKDQACFVLHSLIYLHQRVTDERILIDRGHHTDCCRVAHKVSEHIVMRKHLIPILRVINFSSEFLMLLRSELSANLLILVFKA